MHFDANGNTIERINPFGTGTGSRLLTLPVMYRHDKPEGVVVIDSRTLAIANDDDFGVTDDDGALVEKILPATSQVDCNAIWLIRLPGELLP